ncbi:MAG: hypothetical protein WDO73_37870 [Ignavibacteriota bacterium]
MLAGDHLKSASDLGVPLVAVGLLYQTGVLPPVSQCRPDGSRNLTKTTIFRTSRLPWNGVPDGQPVTIHVTYDVRDVTAQVWRVQVGRVPLYLILDTNVPENPQGRSRYHRPALRRGLWKCGSSRRSCWESAGIARYKPLGIDPHRVPYERRALGFLGLEWVRQLMERRKLFVCGGARSGRRQG